MARAIQKYLEGLFPGLKIALSAGDPLGKNWIEQLKGFLNDAQLAIVCITPENLKACWIHYEAGYLEARLKPSGSIIPFCLGIPPGELPLPLGQFNGLSLNREGIHKLVQTIRQGLDLPIENIRSDNPEAVLKSLNKIRQIPSDPEGIPNLRDFERTILKPYDNLGAADAIVERVVDDFKHHAKGSFPVFLCGSAATGKSTFARLLKTRIDSSAEIANEAAILPTDSYSLPRVDKTARQLHGYEPESHRLEDLTKDFHTLVEKRKPVQIQHYDHKTGSLGPPRPVEPKAITIVEGVYAFHPAEVCKNEGLRVFLYAKKPKAKELKFAADIKERNKTVAKAISDMDGNYDCYEKNIFDKYFHSSNLLVNVDGYWQYAFDDDE
jgi:uridine kinase